ncbi:MAG: DNA mismatch repair endonuclease MutL [Anaerolineaceae bacterium]
MRIRILADEVASQIAAGEVVERPASVIKELLENAIDAGAGEITIQVEGAGRRLIEMRDDGEGMAAADLQLAVARHATSKLQSAEDLFHIHSLGFRGEALASIGSVSHMTVASCPDELAGGSRIEIHGGKEGPVSRSAMAKGTLVRVEDLFYNVPARLKFLKQDQTEKQQMDNLVTRYALAYPHARLNLFQDQKPVIRTSGNGNRREILSNLYGVDIARQMLEVQFNEDDIHIEGFISPISVTRSNRKEITLFVNGRWVQDVPLAAAILQAYHTLLMVGRYPIAILFLQLEPEEVDVNVHPAKAEVRFQHPDKVFGMVQRAVRRSLLAYSAAPQVSVSTWQNGMVLPGQIDASWQMAGQAGSSEWVMPAAYQSHQTEGEISPESEAAVLNGSQPDIFPSGELPLLRLIGQVGSTYLVAEGPDGLYLIDQHAAHERVLFEKFQKQESSRIHSQALLEPVLLQLPPASSRLLREQLPILAHIGFEVEEFGTDTFRIRAIPALLTNLDPAAAVRVVVEDFEEDETPLRAEVEARLIARVCKRSAVKAGKTLNPDEQRTLLRDLETCQSPRTCPHGRPTMIHLSVDLLERQFGRKGSR